MVTGQQSAAKGSFSEVLIEIRLTAKFGVNLGVENDGSEESPNQLICPPMKISRKKELKGGSKPFLGSFRCENG